MSSGWEDNVLAAALRQAALDFTAEVGFGQLVHTSGDGQRTYANAGEGQVTIVGRGLPTFRTTIVGVDLAVLM